MSVTSTCYIHIHELQLVNINCQRMFFVYHQTLIGSKHIIINKRVDDLPWSLRQSSTPPAPQEQSFALTRRRHTSPQPVKTLGQFCPRVFRQKRHFSQKSALKVSKIHALLWAYRGPRERKDAGHTYAHTCLPWSVATIQSTPPRRRLE
jgi:hypothetical protein